MKDVNTTNEYMVLTKNGLFFVKIKMTKRPGNGGNFFSFEFDSY